MAIEEEQEEAVVEAPPPKKGRSKLVIGLLVGVTVLVAGGAYALVAMRGHSAHAKGDAAAATAAPKNQPEFYLQMEPAFVVNFKDDESMRYLSVGVTLMSHDQSALNAAKDADPVLRDALVKLFSSKDYATLNDPAGKIKLQNDALASVRGIVSERLGKPGIDALYFTSFVMQ